MRQRYAAGHIVSIYWIVAQLMVNSIPQPLETPSHSQGESDQCVQGGDTLVPSLTQHNGTLLTGSRAHYDIDVGRLELVCHEPYVLGDEPYKRENPECLSPKASCTLRIWDKLTALQDEVAICSLCLFGLTSTSTLPFRSVARQLSVAMSTH